MIYDLKRSVDLRLLFVPVLHSSLDDLVYIFLDTSDTLAMFLCHRTLILLNNLKTGELDLEGLWRRRRRRLVVLPQEAICGFPSWRKPGRKILLKLLVHPLQGEDSSYNENGEHGVVGSERSSGLQGGDGHDVIISGAIVVQVMMVAAKNRNKNNTR